jgi:ubiquitin-like protein Pup
VATREVAMSERESQRRSTRSDDDIEETGAEIDAAPAVSERSTELDEDVDAMLDEIDDVLETNAAEFVQGFVQKGGQ